MEIAYTSYPGNTVSLLEASGMVLETIRCEMAQMLDCWRL